MTHTRLYTCRFLCQKEIPECLWSMPRRGSWAARGQGQWGDSIVYSFVFTFHCISGLSLQKYSTIYLQYSTPPLSRGVGSKTPSGCLKLCIVPNPICPMFFLYIPIMKFNL